MLRTCQPPENVSIMSGIPDNMGFDTKSVKIGPEMAEIWLEV